LKRNCILCPEVDVNEQFLPGKSIFLKFPEKIEIFQRICLENSKSFENVHVKIEIIQIFAWKNRFFKLPEKS